MHTDPGLQPERTSLAWTRTALATGLVAALSLRFGHSYGLALVPAVAIIGVLVTAALATQHRRYHRASAGITAERLTPPILPVLLLGTGVLVLGLLVLGAVLTHPM